MDSNVYAKRREIIALIYEAKRLVPLPRIEVRVTENDPKVLGCAEMRRNRIWITSRSVASRVVVFHEILHAVFGQCHVIGCPLMGASVRPSGISDAQVNALFIKYATL